MDGMMSCIWVCCLYLLFAGREPWAGGLGVKNYLWERPKKRAGAPQIRPEHGNGAKVGTHCFPLGNHQVLNAFGRRRHSEKGGLGAFRRAP